MNAKKIIALLLVVLMSVFAFASCGGGGNDDDKPKTAAEVIADADAALESTAYQMTLSFDLTSDNEEANDAFQSMLGDMTMVNSVNGDDLKLDMSMMGMTVGLVYVDGVVYLNSGSEKVKFAATEEQLAEITSTTTMGVDISATDFNTLTLEEVDGKQVVTATDIKPEAEEKLDSMFGMSLVEDVDISDLALVATVKDGKYESLVVSFSYTTSGITVTANVTSAFTYNNVAITAPADAATYTETTFDEIYGGGSGDVEYIFSHDEYIAVGEDTEVTIIAYVQGKQSWWDNKATIYAEDNDGGYLLYETACDKDTYDQLTPGMKIKVKGYTSSYAGLYEIYQGTLEVIDDGDTYVADALDVTNIYGDIEEIVDYQAMTVTLSNVTVVASVDDAGEEHAFFYGDGNSGSAGEDIYFNVQIGDATYTLALEKYLTADGTDVYEAAEALKIGDTINVEGFLYWWNGPQVHVTSITSAK